MNTCICTFVIVSYKNTIVFYHKIKKNFLRETVITGKVRVIHLQK